MTSSATQSSDPAQDPTRDSAALVAFAHAVDLKAALRGLRQVALDCAVNAVIFRTNERGMELVMAAVDPASKERVPAVLGVVPPGLDRLRHSPPGTWGLIASEDTDLPELAGYHVLALFSEARAVGFMLIDQRPTGQGERSLLIACALVAARIRATHDALELKRRREEHFELQVKSETIAATGMLSAGVAHELNNPLGVVLGLAEIMMADSELPERVRADARVIAECTTRAVSVVRQLLSYGRGGGLELEPAEVVELVESCVRLFETAQGDTHVEVVRQYEPGSHLVLADAFRLQQAFLAILDNALQAVASTDYPGRVVVEVSASIGDHVTVRITDNGPGIEPSVRSRIFDPFFTTRKFGSGTGMGLALVQRTVMDHRGEIRFEGPPGGGASFVIDLDRYDT